MKRKILTSVLALSSVVVFSSAFAMGEGGLTKGTQDLEKQVLLLNIAMNSVQEQVETHVRLKGGSCTGVINFEAGAGERFSGLLDMGTGKTGVTADCVVTLVTLADTTNNYILNPLTNQTFVATPYIDSKATSTAYTATSNAPSIAKWKIVYTAGAANLKALTILGTTTNILRTVGSPLSTAF